MLAVTLTVNDPQKSARFYIDKFGFKDMDGLPGPDGIPVFWAGSYDDVMIMFNRIGSDSLTGERGVGVELHLTLPDNTDIDGLYAQLRGEGRAIVQEIKDEFWGERRFIVRDLDGYQVSVAKKIGDPTMEEMAAYTSKRPE